jgi:hypothetical protein
MTYSGRTVRTTVVGLALAATAAVGFGACGSSSKTQNNQPAGQAPATTAKPASPPTTSASSSGGASF